MKIKIPVTVRRGISKRSHEKIGDCEQSTKDASNNEVTFVTPGADILIGSSHTQTFFWILTLKKLALVPRGSASAKKARRRQNGGIQGSRKRRSQGYGPNEKERENEGWYWSCQKQDIRGKILWGYFWDRFINFDIHRNFRGLSVPSYNLMYFSYIVLVSWTNNWMLCLILKVSLILVLVSQSTYKMTSFGI